MTLQFVALLGLELDSEAVKAKPACSAAIAVAFAFEHGIVRILGKLFRC